jgi:hypothetical protein
LKLHRTIHDLFTTTLRHHEHGFSPNQTNETNEQVFILTETTQSHSESRRGSDFHASVDLTLPRVRWRIKAMNAANSQIHYGG